MIPDVRLVGSLGVARLTLVGGPLDGERRFVVVGAPVVVPVPTPDPKVQDSYGGFVLFGFGGSSRVEGDEWKDDDPQSGSKKKASRYAVYAPVRDGDRVLPEIRFVGTFDWTPLP